MVGSASEMARGKHSFETLDAMRGVAALAVVLHHSRILFGAQLAPSGYLAVDLFFALSGCVLANAYDGRGLSLAQFMRLRFIRLWPLYAAGLALGVVLASTALLLHRANATAAQIAESAILNIAYLPSFGSGTGDLFPLNVPAWSLFFELLINIAFCTVIFRSRASILGLLAVSAAALSLAARLNGDLSGGVGLDTAWVGLARVGWSFAAGVFLRRYAPKPDFGGRAWPGVALLAGLGALLLADPGRYRAAYDLAFVLALSPFMIWFATGLKVPAVLAGPYAVIGAASYAIYAIHHPLVDAAHYVGERLRAPPALLGCGFVVGVFVLAIWLDKAFDRPARRWLSQWWATPTPSPALA